MGWIGSMYNVTDLGPHGIPIEECAQFVHGGRQRQKQDGLIQQVLI